MPNVFARLMYASLLSISPWLCATAQATIYHVTPGGGGDCTTPQPCIDRLIPGDTVELHAGTYDITIHSIPAGTESARITLAGARGETAVIKPSTSGAGQGALIDVTVPYVTFENLTVDGTAYCQDGANNLMKLQPNSHHIRVSNSVLKNCLALDSGGSPRSATKGILFTTTSTDNEIVQTEITNVLGYGIYMNSANNVVDGCTIHHNFRFGLHMYDDTADNVHDNIVRNTRLWANGDNTNCEGGCVQAGVVMVGTGHLLYNTVIDGNKGGGIQLEASATRLFNNTIYGNETNGCIFGGGSAEIRNTICANNQGDIAVGGDHSNNVLTDPGLADPAAGDFHLKPTATAAIKTGMDLSGLFSTDITGATRPTGAFDLGAYALGATAPSEAGLPPIHNLRLLKTQTAQ
jgi:parallel beta-helix repeat protein